MNPATTAGDRNPAENGRPPSPVAPALPHLPRPTPWDRECMAWHEAGHAVVSMSLPCREPVVRVSINPGDEAFGIMQTAPRRHHNDTRETLLAAMAVAFAGTISERRFLRRVTTSCADDLAMAFSIARDMVMRFGMGHRTGLCCPGAVAPDSAGPFLSERFRHDADRDIRDLAATAEHMAHSVLRRNATAVSSLSNALLKHGTLLAPDLAAFQTTRAGSG